MAEATYTWESLYEDKFILIVRRKSEEEEIEVEVRMD